MNLESQKLIFEKDLTDQYENEIKEFLNCIGHTEAFVTNCSIVYDFFIGENLSDVEIIEFIEDRLPDKKKGKLRYTPDTKILDIAIQWNKTIH